MLRTKRRRRAANGGPETLPRATSNDAAPLGRPRYGPCQEASLAWREAQPYMPAGRSAPMNRSVWSGDHFERQVIDCGVSDSMHRTSKGVERRIAARRPYLAQRAAMPDRFWAAPLWPPPRSVAIREDATLHADGAFSPDEHEHLDCALSCCGSCGPSGRATRKGRQAVSNARALSKASRNAAPAGGPGAGRGAEPGGECGAAAPCVNGQRGRGERRAPERRYSARVQTTVFPNRATPT